MLTDIEYSEVDGENMMKPVFDKTPITCLSIFDSMYTHIHLHTYKHAHTHIVASGLLLMHDFM